MVQPWLLYWRLIQKRFHADGDHAIPEKRGRLQSFYPKRKGRKGQVVMLLMLVWCLASLAFLILDLISSYSPYKSANQVFRVRLLTGWSHATSNEEFSEKLNHPYVVAVQQFVQTRVAHSSDQSLIVSAKTELTVSNSPFEAIIKKANHPIASNLKIDAVSNDIHVVRGENEIAFENSSAGKKDELQVLPQSSVPRLEIVRSTEKSGVKDKSMNNTNELVQQKNLDSLHNSSAVQHLLSNYVGEQGEIRMGFMEGISCDRSHWRTDICFISGDVRVKTKSIHLYSQDKHQSHVVEKVKPYPRKWETAVMEKVDEVIIESSYTPSVSASSNDTIMNCNVNYSTPAVIFSTGGYSGNVYHDFNDGLIPLYITTRHLQGEVVFLILEYHDWWLKKYGQVMQQLSRYPVVDLSNDYNTVHCFREAIVGLKIHDELSINPKLLTNHVGSIRDFHQMLQQAFIPSDDRQLSNYASANSGGVVKFGSSKKLKLVLIARKGSRSILNQADLIALAKHLGFQVKVIIPTDTTKLEYIFRLLHSCDVMMGVHGAAMTHLLFMRPGSIFIQIIPLGTDYPALAYYGEPAKKLGLDYTEYKITAEESSLSQMYDKHDKVLTDPQTIASQGWPSLKKYYLQGQSVRLSLPRIKLVLQKALQKIKLGKSQAKFSNQ